jgi:hypothetical protein
MTRVLCFKLHNTDLGVKYPSYIYRQKVQILLFKSKWDTLSVLNIESEKYLVSKNRGAAPLKKKKIHVHGAVYSWVRVTHESTIIRPPRTMMIPQYELLSSAFSDSCYIYQ